MQPGITPFSMMRAFGEENKNGNYNRAVFTRENLRRVGGFAKPHSRKIALFLVTSVLSALVVVAAPLLAGRVVDEIVAGGALTTVVLLAVAIGVFGLLEAFFGVINRLLSSQIGEGLIFQLRSAVFRHVQRMPVAFFMRTRTGALVSRLNNDVLGAQRAFANTLSGVVSSFVQLVLTLLVMGSLSWQVTLLTLVIVPIFLIPARYMGRRLAAMRR